MSVTQFRALFECCPSQQDRQHHPPAMYVCVRVCVGAPTSSSMPGHNHVEGMWLDAVTTCLPVNHIHPNRHGKGPTVLQLVGGRPGGEMLLGPG